VFDIPQVFRLLQLLSLFALFGALLYLLAVLNVCFIHSLYRSKPGSWS